MAGKTSCFRGKCAAAFSPMSGWPYFLTSTIQAFSGSTATCRLPQDQGAFSRGYDADEIARADARRAALGAQQLSQPRKGIMKTILDDMKAFITEHRKVIYFVVILLIIDRFFLRRAMENRLKALAEKLLGKVEDKLHSLTTPPAIPPATPPTP